MNQVMTFSTTSTGILASSITINQPIFQSPAETMPFLNIGEIWFFYQGTFLNPTVQFTFSSSSHFSPSLTISNVNDGDIQSFFSSASGDTNPTVTINFPPTNIDLIVLVSRQDCCMTRNEGATVNAFLGLNPTPVWSSQVPLTESPVYSFEPTNKAATGQYISSLVIDQPNAKNADPFPMLNIAEVLLYYQGKQLSPASLTFTASSNDPCCPASSANDGNIGTYYHSIYNTWAANPDHDPTLTISFDATYVDMVVIVTRQDCCYWREEGANVKAYISGNPSPVWSTTVPLTESLRYDFSLLTTSNDGIAASSLTIDTTNTVNGGPLLNVAEVWVFSNGVKLASNALSFSGSSLYANSNLVAALANDLNTGTFYHSGVGDTDPTLTISFATTFIDAVIIVNRADCCQDRLTSASVKIYAGGAATPILTSSTASTSERVYSFVFTKTLVPGEGITQRNSHNYPYGVQTYFNAIGNIFYTEDLGYACSPCYWSSESHFVTFNGYSISAATYATYMDTVNNPSDAIAGNNSCYIDSDYHWVVLGAFASSLSSYVGSSNELGTCVWPCIIVGAWGQSSVVFTDTTESGILQNNGVNWYYIPEYAMGFAKNDSSINLIAGYDRCGKFNIDYTGADVCGPSNGNSYSAYRLSWSLDSFNGEGGQRAGTLLDLGLSTSFYKFAYLCQTLPTGQPSNSPSAQPSDNPSSQPTKCPTVQPSHQPSGQPLSQPSQEPTKQPTAKPTAQPSQQPTNEPSPQPTDQPSCHPTSMPTQQPTERPTSQPSSQPTSHPSSQPSSDPSMQPSVQPSSRPSSQPSSQPSQQPSCQPSSDPSSQPSSQPSNQPSSKPSVQPSSQPSHQPSCQPSSDPTCQPTSHPSRQPTCQPSGQPSTQPSPRPSSRPSNQPSDQPSSSPSDQPSTKPSEQPTVAPSTQPTCQPSNDPTHQPSQQPTTRPTYQPSRQPSTRPSAQPSRQPTHQPSREPSGQPSRQPLSRPSGQPTVQPTSRPSSQPSSQPTRLPSHQPTSRPSGQPSRQPSREPSGQPSRRPSSQPSRQPSSGPSQQPSRQPTRQPSRQPTSRPSIQPSQQPSSTPTDVPTINPTFRQTDVKDTYHVSNWFSFALINDVGGVMTWGDSLSGGDSSSVADSLKRGVATVVSSRRSFAALKSNGQIVAWGHVSQYPTYNLSTTFRRVAKIIPNDFAFAVLMQNGSVGAFGDPNFGGDISLASTDVRSFLWSDVHRVYANAAAFVALRSDGTIAAWGDTSAGGGVTSFNTPAFYPVNKIFANRYAFCAVLSDHTVATFGNPHYGGQVTVNAFVETVAATYGAFAALTVNRTVRTWGMAERGGDLNYPVRMPKKLTDVWEIYSTETAFAAILFDGSLVTWGDPSAGGKPYNVNEGQGTDGKQLTNFKYVYSNGAAFFPQRKEGFLFFGWGNSRFGAGYAPLWIPFDQVVVTWRAITVRHGGFIESWGNENEGGNNIYQSLMSDVATVCANRFAFAAIRSDGTVVSWGLEQYGGNATSHADILKNVTRCY